MNCLTPSPKLSHPEPISGKCNIDISSQRCYVSCNNTWNTCLIVCVHFRAILLRIKWKNQDIQYYSVKGLGGRHFNSRIFVLGQLWGQQLMSSQSDHYRRLFSGTLGVLPIVFPNRALGGTLVHFLRDLPYCAMKKSIFPTRKYKTIGFPRVTPLLSHEYFSSNTHRTTLLSLVSPLYKSAVPTEVV